MSLESRNILPKDIKIVRLCEIIEFLGYVQKKCEFQDKSCLRTYFWMAPNKHCYYVGIELSIYKKEKSIEVYTRTRAGRSKWELEQQNKTLKTLRDYFGGSFITDYGSNKYFPAEEASQETTPLASGLYVQRWILNNALMKAKIYLDYIEKNGKNEYGPGNIYSNEMTGLSFLDELKPIILSNNIVLPYIIGAWENFLRESYSIILKYARKDDRLIKPEKVMAESLIEIATGNITVEEAIAKRLSFQRPRNIVCNYRDLDKSLDLNQIFMKPYKNRKESLFDSIDRMVVLRNELVHEGKISTKVDMKSVKKFIDDIEEAANRIYKTFGREYSFKPNFDF